MVLGLNRGPAAHEQSRCLDWPDAMPKAKSPYTASMQTASAGTTAQAAKANARPPARTHRALRARALSCIALLDAALADLQSAVAGDPQVRGFTEQTSSAPMLVAPMH